LSCLKSHICPKFVDGELFVKLRGYRGIRTRDFHRVKVAIEGFLMWREN
jgi:hypothetical protein